MKQKISYLLFILAHVAMMSACATPLTYSAKEIRGQIVDAETGEPIEGAVVVAQWVLFHGGIGHGGHGRRIHIHETVTDQDGSYFIPAWGPKVRPPMTELANRDPEIIIFKSGYDPKRLRNSEMDNSDSLRVSEWDGKMVRLMPTKRSLEDYARRLESMSIALPHDDKEWRAFPRMVLALAAENRRLRAQGLDTRYRTSIFEIEYFDEADKKFLKRFENE